MTQPASAGASSTALPATVDALSAALIALYADAETQLLDSLSRAAAHGLHDTAASMQVLLLGQMQNNARRVATQLALRSGPLTQQVITAAAQRGDAAALTAIRNAVEGHPSLAAQYLARAAGVSGHALTAANAIQLDLQRGLTATWQGIVRFADDAYRAAVAEAATRQVLNREALTPATTQRLAWRELTRDGVTGYTDTAGRRWNLSSYVEMATRTAVQRAYNASHQARMTSVGIGYFTVPGDGHPCPLCRPWEGAVIGPRPGVVRELSAVSGQPVTFTVKATVDEARAAGLWHPNCRHTLTAYLPGVTRTTAPRAWTDADQARYDATQRLRYLERQVRAYKREQAAALDDLDRQRAARKVRAYQAQIRTHVARHNLVRRRRREQLDLGNKP